MAPSFLPLNFSPTLHLTAALRKRSDSCDNDYTAACTTHRTILLVASLIVCAGLCIGFIVLSILKRNRSRANQGLTLSNGPNKGMYSELNRMERQAGFAPARLPSERVYENGDMPGRAEYSWRKGHGWGGDETARYEAPPPYTPRAPEAARMNR
ncbi:uncharacterized protein SETTUDRAFT_23787 [Exserohilum turcica Et28A]|uniref:Uncharacterized protein n=1 Tax=Exserohilum turcicum (strain 28A) TaxID=671987 RepID=R0JV54_EXST2|nr:uncharacterized protein SETTUDRAFT_23787 [Exserohilum turcica Et28A]EOA81389.1 hypothetical protein SETTUDRAFT_23787 [Exserohilum turcica Et28A]